jgi:hypothetical protein
MQAANCGFRRVRFNGTPFNVFDEAGNMQFSRQILSFGQIGRFTENFVFRWRMERHWRNAAHKCLCLLDLYRAKTLKAVPLQRTQSAVCRQPPLIEDSVR